MHSIVTLNKYKETDLGTELYITVPDRKLGDMLTERCIKRAEMRFDD